MGADAGSELIFTWAVSLAYVDGRRLEPPSGPRSRAIVSLNTYPAGPGLRVEGGVVDLRGIEDEDR